jgi:hypothetical protein
MEKSRDEPFTTAKRPPRFRFLKEDIMYTSTTTEVVIKDNQKKLLNDTSWAGVRNAVPVFEDEDVDTTMSVVARQARVESYEHEQALTPTTATVTTVARLLGASKYNLYFEANFSWIMEPKATWTLEDSELNFKSGYSLVVKANRTFNGTLLTEAIPSVRVVMNRRAKAKRFILSFGRKSTRRVGESFNVTRPSDLANYLKK